MSADNEVGGSKVNDRVSETQRQARAILTNPQAHVSLGNGLVIGYAEVAALKPLSSEQLAKIQQLSWFFAHASVGGNMVEGLSDLLAISSSPYPLDPLSAGDAPPTLSRLGVVYEFDRGNPGWQAKVDDFVDYLGNGWHEPVANLVLNKFCYIDQDANADYYLQSQAALETSHPTTLFIYATMPLTTDADEDNYRRHLFNEKVRQWVANHNKVLFDIADIEAHSPEGTPQTFEFKGQACQKLEAGFTTDGGHLDDPAGTGRRQVAKGFYALAVALMETDRDQDGLSDFEELIAGTNPLHAGDGVKLSVETLPATRDAAFRWPSVSLRTYQLEQTPSLGSPWQKLGPEIQATPPLNRWTNHPSGSGFYRLGVRR